MTIGNPLVVGALLGGLALAGCGHGYVAAYYGPPPPAPVVGAVGVAPGPGFVWIDGFYELRGSRWVWVPGRWARPPRPRAVYVAPRWEREGRGYHFHRGYWR